MLKTEKTVRYTGRVYVGTEQATYMNADIAADGKVSFQSTNTNQELFRANRKACQADMNEFEDMVYDEADKIAAEKEATNTEEEETN